MSERLWSCQCHAVVEAGPMRERTSASIGSSSMFLIASTCLATTGPTSVLRPPTDVYTLLYPDILNDNWKICATIDVGTAKSFLEEGDVSLSSHAMPPRHPAPSREPLHHPERWTTAPKHKNQGTNPIRRRVCASGCWRRSRAASASSALSCPCGGAQRPINARSSLGRQCPSDHLSRLSAPSPTDA